MLSATSLLTARMIGCPTAASAWALVGVTDPAAMVAVMTGPAVGLGVASAGDGVVVAAVGGVEEGSAVVAGPDPHPVATTAATVSGIHAFISDTRGPPTGAPVRA